ncbi:MAG: hypothetical protein HQL03_03845, partial [Nitrospirae bacterium]|nr:hypothetical protein [Nitrospirota bacterium]
MSALLKKYRGFFNKPIFHILIIVLAGFFSYSNSFKIPFYFDDEYVIEVSRGFNPWGGLGLKYIGNLLLFINYKIHGNNVIGYHIVNLSIHLINAVLVYWFMLLLLKAQRQLHKDSDSVSQSFKNQIAFFVAIVFVSHPLQLQAVTLIIQRYASTATLFYVLTLIVYIKYRFLIIDEVEIKYHSPNAIKYLPIVNYIQVEGKKGAAPPPFRTPRKGTSPLDPIMLNPKRYIKTFPQVLNKSLRIKSISLYLLALIIAFIASIAKQVTITLPIIITIVEFMFFSRKPLKRLLLCIP